MGSRFRGNDGESRGNDGQSGGMTKSEGTGLARCTRDEIGRVVTDLHFHTSVRNVYAAGDIIHGPQMAIAAPGTGAVAAVAIHHSLLPELRKLQHLQG